MNTKPFVTISRRAKRITLQRYLLAKILYEKEKFNIADLGALFENQLWLERKCGTEEDFKKKFGRSLEVLSELLKLINFRVQISEKAINGFRKKLLDSELKDFIFPRRNFQSIRTQYGKFYQLSKEYSELYSKIRKVREVRRIGIGYRDKGTRKDPAKDGSPSWQEVALHEGEIYEIPRGPTKKPTSLGGRASANVTGKLRNTGEPGNSKPSQTPNRSSEVVKRKVSEKSYDWRSY